MKRGLLLTFVGVFAAFGLSLPISNLFVQRTSLVSDEDQEFKAVSDTFVKKCADCHTQDLAQQPLYFNFPLAESIIHKNIKNGQSSFLLNKAKLSGKEKFSADDLVKLSAAMAKGNMPPLQYLMLHWTSALNEREQRLLAIWVHKRLQEYDIRPSQ